MGAADVDARVDPNSIASGLLETYNVVSSDTVDIEDTVDTNAACLGEHGAGEQGHCHRRSAQPAQDQICL